MLKGNPAACAKSRPSTTQRLVSQHALDIRHRVDDSVERPAFLTQIVKVIFAEWNVLVEWQKAYVLIELKLTQSQLDARAKGRDVALRMETKRACHPFRIWVRTATVEPFAQTNVVGRLPDFDDGVHSRPAGPTTVIVAHIDLDKPVARAGALSALAVDPRIDLPREVP